MARSIREGRTSGSGPLTSLKGQMAVAAFNCGSAGATQTGTFAGALIGDVVQVSPIANLTGGLSVGYARMVASNYIVMGFSNTDASASFAAATFNVELGTTR